MNANAMNWTVTTSTGQAGPFHAQSPTDETGHQIWVRQLPAPALVLGSTQPDELIRQDRAEADGIEVCRRRSGGGLVFINPDTDCWIDVVIPRSSPLWADDVGRAFHWLGEVWADVLGTMHGSAFDVCKTSASSGLGRVWCFADLGHGEVSLGRRKVVGLSQRRTRTWARIQGLMLGSWPGDHLLPYVDLDFLVHQHPDRYADVEPLRPGLVAAGFPPDAVAPSPDDVASRFVASLRRFDPDAWATPE